MTTPRDEEQPATISDSQNGLSSVPIGEFPQIEGYQITAKLGEGGNAVVYQARQFAAGGRIVALKVMRGEQFASPQKLRRFEREVEIAAELQHPNIAQIYDSGLASGQHYFAMQYIKGEPPDKYCARHNLPLKDRLRLFAKICQTVAFAHGRGVIHRDLKPSNILVDANGEPHVLDFGLAKFQSTDAEEVESMSLLTMDGALLGTLPYMAPEQAAGKIAAVDIRTDVYALGVILYELLTGKFPYEVAGQLASVLRHIAEDEPKRPSTVNREIGNEVETIILRALSKEPDRRYASALNLAEDISHFLEGEPIDAKRDSGWYVLRKTAQRHWVPVLVGLVFMVVLAAATVVNFVLYRRATMARNEAESARRVAQEQRTQAQAERDRAERALVELRQTAPTFYRQTQGFIKEHDFAKALEMIAYAIALVPDEAEYRVLQGNILQTLLRLGEAREAYRQALARNPGHAVAAENLRLCEKVLQENQRQAEVTPSSLNELQAAMRRQGRFDEAVAILKPLDENRQRLVDGWNDVLKKAGWKGYNLSIDPQGILSLRLDVFVRCNVDNLAPIRGMPLTKLDLGYSAKVADLTPLKGMPLREARIVGKLINNLEPLRGLPLEFLSISGTTVSDLSPLAGLRLKRLYLDCPDVMDISPLKGMPLESLDVNAYKGGDFSALQGMPLTDLYVQSIAFTNLCVLQGMPLEMLNLSFARVSDLNPLKGLRRLQELHLGMNVFDLSPLRGMPLRRLNLRGCINLTNLDSLGECRELETLLLPPKAKEIEFLRYLPKLKRLLGYQSVNSGQWEAVPPVAKFWEEYDAQKTCAALSGAQRKGILAASEAPGAISVRLDSADELALLKDFPSINELRINYPMTDLSPLRGLTALSVLNISNTPISDLRPLAGTGMTLRKLDISSTKIADLSPLQEGSIAMYLRELLAANSQVSNIAPLFGTHLSKLDLDNCSGVTDLAPLRNSGLTWLRVSGTSVSNLSPINPSTEWTQPLTFLDWRATPVADLNSLRRMPLRQLLLSGCSQLRNVEALLDCPQLKVLVLPDIGKNIEVLRKHPNLQRLGLTMQGEDTNSVPTVAEFWTAYDAQKAASP